MFDVVIYEDSKVLSAARFSSFDQADRYAQLKTSRLNDCRFRAAILESGAILVGSYVIGKKVP
jgi:hypothetical protein